MKHNDAGGKPTIVCVRKTGALLCAWEKFVRFCAREKNWVSVRQPSSILLHNDIVTLDSTTWNNGGVISAYALPSTLIGRQWQKKVLWYLCSKSPVKQVLDHGQQNWNFDQENRNQKIETLSRGVSDEKIDMISETHSRSLKCYCYYFRTLESRWSTCTLRLLIDAVFLYSHLLQSS